jgi:NAD(P)-dependent dehydrogenase (short-subunit alcohol dehydrogenase family)
METIEGRHAFITGGASGIGLGIAQALLEAGANVTIADFRTDHIATAREFVESLHKARHAAFVELDVTDRDGLARAAEDTEAQFGPVHILVTNAGVGIQGAVADATFDDWDFGLGVNLGGTVNAIVTFLPRMIRHSAGGHIVITASLSALTPAPRDAAIYATGKAAQLAMGESMRDELADHGIGVTVLMPGPFKTNIREAGQNRPARYREHTGYRAEEENLAQRQDAPDWADPLDAGRMTVEAIRENRLYVVTHGEFKGWAETRFEEILASYPPPKDPERAKTLGRRRTIKPI